MPNGEFSLNQSVTRELTREESSDIIPEKDWAL
jgi:hypothetical protein